MHDIAKVGGRPAVAEAAPPVRPCRRAKCKVRIRAWQDSQPSKDLVISRNIMSTVRKRFATCRSCTSDVPMAVLILRLDTSWLKLKKAAVARSKRSGRGVRWLLRSISGSIGGSEMPGSEFLRFTDPYEHQKSIRGSEATSAWRTVKATRALVEALLGAKTRS